MYGRTRIFEWVAWLGECDQEATGSKVKDEAGMYQYPVQLKPDSNGTLLVTFPDVPEAITFG